MGTAEIVQYCAEECHRQQSGELSVANMYRAWEYAELLPEYALPLWSEILELGALVEPIKNKHGWRTTPVLINGQTLMPPSLIGHAMASLYQNGGLLSPIEWYKEFETIHPFIDGNGRVGSLIFNLMRGTIHTPIAPPDIFKKGS